MRRCIKCKRDISKYPRDVDLCGRCQQRLRRTFSNKEFRTPVKRSSAIACCLMLACMLLAACSSAPNNAYGSAPSYIQQWIPGGCTDQELPWEPYFQAGMGNSQLDGLGVQVLRCGRVWHFLAWDVDPSHNYHELSAPGRTACPNGNVRFTSASVLLRDPYNGSFVAILEERGQGSDWVASQVSMTQTVDTPVYYPPHC